MFGTEPLRAAVFEPEWFLTSVRIPRSDAPNDCSEDVPGNKRARPQVRRLGAQCHRLRSLPATPVRLHLCAGGPCLPSTGRY